MTNTFGIPIIPVDDPQRINKLQEYGILDTPAEGPFKHVASLAAHIFKVPIALISFVDTERVWFKANVGMEEVRELSRGICLCSLAILNESLTIFNDALTEPCLLRNPMVTGNFGLRFYAGVPLKTADGYKLGSFCIMDKKPHYLNVAGRDMLVHLAGIVMQDLERWKEKKQVKMDK